MDAGAAAISGIGGSRPEPAGAARDHGEGLCKGNRDQGRGAKKEDPAAVLDQEGLSDTRGPARNQYHGSRQTFN